MDLHALKDRLGGTRMLLLAIIAGIVSGIGAVLFRGLIALLHNLFLLGQFSLAYDTNVHTPASPWGPAVMLVPIIGAVLVAYLVSNFAPEARGHGVPEVIDAVHYGRGIIRPIVAVIKSLASAISIGTGGSVGREGPIIQIGASFGSTLAQKLGLTTWERMALIACGSGGGIAATFDTPVGGILFAVELMMHEVSARTLVPVTLATIVATYIGRLVFGVHPAFDIPAIQDVHTVIDGLPALLLFAGLGIVAGLMSTLFIRTVYWCEDIFEKRVNGSYYRQHLLGMALVGALLYTLMATLGHYYVEGVGYATIDEVLRGWAPVGVLLLLCAAKLLATGLTLGSGASGGIFSPALFMGATLGAAYAAVADRIAPGVGVSTATFALAGMAGLVGGSTGAALAAIVMVFEMTLDYSAIIPMTLTVAISYEVRRLLCRESIYSFKLVRRGHRVPEALQADARLSLRASDVMDTRFMVLPTGLDQAEIERRRHEVPGVEFVLFKGPDGISGVSVGGAAPETNFEVLHQDLSLPQCVSCMYGSNVPVALVSADGSRAENRIRGVIIHQRLAAALADAGKRYEDDPAPPVTR